MKLERDLTDRQSARFARAYRETGADSVEGFRKVLLGLLDPAERAIESTSGCVATGEPHGCLGRQAAHPGRRRRHPPARAAAAPSCRRTAFASPSPAHAAEARASGCGVLDFDLIVLDVMMPGQTGLDFATEIRR